MGQAPLSRNRMIEAVEAVDKCGGSVTKAARLLGVNRLTLNSRLEIARKAGVVPAPKPDPEPQIVEGQKPRVVVRAGRTSTERIRVLAMGDLHDAPDIPKDRFRWLGRLASDEGCDHANSIGDWLTLDSLNTHVANETLLGKEKSPFARCIQSGAESLGEFDRGAGSHSLKRHIELGNHERRAWLYEDHHPETAGMLTGELLHLFESHGFSHTPYGEYFFLGGVGFIHCAINRLNKSYGGKNAEATIANDAMFDHVIGHSHVKREHRAPKLGPSRHVTIVNLGCGLPWGHVEPYMYHGALTGWWWGARIIDIECGQITSVRDYAMNELERRYG